MVGKIGENSKLEPANADPGQNFCKGNVKAEKSRPLSEKGRGGRSMPNDRAGPE